MMMASNNTTDTTSNTNKSNTNMKQMLECLTLCESSSNTTEVGFFVASVMVVLVNYFSIIDRMRNYINSSKEGMPKILDIESDSEYDEDGDYETEAENDTFDDALEYPQETEDTDFLFTGIVPGMTSRGCDSGDGNENESYHAYDNENDNDTVVRSNSRKIHRVQSSTVSLDSTVYSSGSSVSDSPYGDESSTSTPPDVQEYACFWRIPGFSSKTQPQLQFFTEAPAPQPPRRERERQRRARRNRRAAAATQTRTKRSGKNKRSRFRVSEDDVGIGGW